MTNVLVALLAASTILGWGLLIALGTHNLELWRNLRLVVELTRDLLDEAAADDPFDGYDVTQGLNQFHRHLHGYIDIDGSEHDGVDGAVHYARLYREPYDNNNIDDEEAPF